MKESFLFKSKRGLVVPHNYIMSLCKAYAVTVRTALISGGLDTSGSVSWLIPNQIRKASPRRLPKLKIDMTDNFDTSPGPFPQNGGTC